MGAAPPRGAVASLGLLLGLAVAGGAAAATF